MFKIATKVAASSIRRPHQAFNSRNIFGFCAASAQYLNKGSLEIRNSDTLEMKLMKVNQESQNIEEVSVQINSSATLRDFGKVIEEQLAIKNTKVPLF